VSDVLESLEQAKTAMRAMSKYVPIDLVRRLYRENSEPVLGGEEMEISLMFTGHQGLHHALRTARSRRPSRTRWAAILDVLTRIIQQETHGTIDKYIGDAIMTMWERP